MRPRGKKRHFDSAAGLDDARRKPYLMLTARGEKLMTKTAFGPYTLAARAVLCGVDRAIKIVEMHREWGHQLRAPRNRAQINLSVDGLR